MRARIRMPALAGLAASLGLLAMSGCDPGGEEATEESTSRAVSGECDPLDLDCQTGELDPAQKAQLEKLERAAREASVNVEGAVVGNRMEIRYYDNHLGRWFYTIVWRYGYQHLLVNRYVMNDAGVAVGYYAKSTHPDDPAQNWHWTDYNRAAAAVGRPHSESLQLQLDAAAGIAFSSETALGAFRALKAGDTVPTEVARACAVSCFNDLAESSFVLGALSTAACGTLAGAGGIACGVAAGAFLWRYVGIEDCHENCLSCYETMEESCKIGSVVPRGCNGSPFRCRDGTIVIVRDF